MDDRDKAIRLRLAPEFGRLAAEVSRLRLLLRDLEWSVRSEPDPDHPNWLGSCPSCHNCKFEGHAADCPLKAALEGR